MMNIQVLPLSPPREHEDIEEKKKVKFCLKDQVNNDLLEAEDEENEILNSPTIDINAHIVPDTILVALLNRDQEMKELVKHNQSFFNTIQLQLGKKEWQYLQRILYSQRQQLNDYQWLSKIEKCLNRIPTAISTFKDLVGYVNMEEDHHDDSDEEDHPSKDHHRKAYEESTTFFQHINVCHIRQYPEKLNEFKSSYPQFFINCQQVLSKSEMTILETTLFTPRSTLSDQQWKSIINVMLSSHDNLMDQLKEIIAYEIDDDN
ncbi:unnamed protein product [Cunninghamella blakesleeana]